MIRISSHPYMSTAYSHGHKKTKETDNISMVWQFLDVMMRFHLYMMCFYVILWKYYGAQSDFSFMVIWEQHNQCP